MRLVEIWTIGGLDSDSFILIDPYYGDIRNGNVINGNYEVYRNKEKNILTIFAPGGAFDSPSHYLGDVAYKGDYNKTIGDYEDTRKVVGQNLIKVKKPEKESWSDEPSF